MKGPGCQAQIDMTGGGRGEGKEEEEREGGERGERKDNEEEEEEKENTQDTGRKEIDSNIRKIQSGLHFQQRWLQVK